MCTCHPAVGHSVLLTLQEQPKTKCLSDRMSGVYHRQEMKFTLLPTQQLSALLNENIFKIKAKYSTYSPGKVTALGTLVSSKQSSSLQLQKKYICPVLKTTEHTSSFLLSDKGSFSLTNLILRTVWFLEFCNIVLRYTCCLCFKARMYLDMLNVFFKMYVVLSQGEDWRGRQEPLVNAKLPGLQKFIKF